MDSMKPVFGCDSLEIINSAAINYFARVLYIVYGSPKNFCQKVNDFEQSEVNAILNECFTPNDNTGYGDGVGIEGGEADGGAAGVEGPAGAEGPAARGGGGFENGDDGEGDGGDE